MQITVDPDRFDALQLRLVGEIIGSVIAGLKEAGVKDTAALSKAARRIAFSVAAIVDGSRVMDLDGSPVVPVLTFATERNGSNLIAADGGSSMHEYVHGTVDDMLTEE